MPTHEQVLNQRINDLHTRLTEIAEMVDEIRTDYYGGEEEDTRDITVGDMNPDDKILE